MTLDSFWVVWGVDYKSYPHFFHNWKIRPVHTSTQNLTNSVFVPGFLWPPMSIVFVMSTSNNPGLPGWSMWLCSPFSKGRKGGNIANPTNAPSTVISNIWPIDRNEAPASRMANEVYLCKCAHSWLCSELKVLMAIGKGEKFSLLLLFCMSQVPTLHNFLSYVVIVIYCQLIMNESLKLVKILDLCAVSLYLPFPSGHWL